ncbi:MAG: hypothetical protein DMF91_20150 [Acidobacteria bacterium]|nr:MAG: hypothetical protein DMF91_20150 [Acidobacteriota bacterium]
MPRRIYIDTSVLGGCFDLEFALWSNGLMRDFRAGRLSPVLSDALATIARVDALVSWNFKHIVRLENIQLFNSVNVQSGYPELNIRSPREVTTYEGH